MSYVYRVSVVAAAAGLLFGFDIAVINGALLFLKQQFGLSDAQVGMAATALLAGCVVGAAIGGWLSDRFGRKPILLFSAILFAFSSVGAALPHNLARVRGGALRGRSWPSAWHRCWRRCTLRRFRPRPFAGGWFR